ncbi:MAG: ABC transporter ATP-binding protein, partial [Propionibacteriaceae bacterium]|nr:ABC transporter ATP-binding protein [Propionibacteriaceae bacterium]
SVEAKRLLGYIPEFPAPYQMLTVAEHLEFIARAYRLTDWEPLAQELLTRFELADRAAKLGKELSKGMQQKLSVCCALLPRPRVVILDEPLVGLDPQGIRELKAMIADLRSAGCALLISTHMIASMDDNWDTTLIMKDGRIQARCRRGELAPGESLEDMYFAIVDQAEGQAAHQPNRHAPQPVAHRGTKQATAQATHQPVHRVIDQPVHQVTDRVTRRGTEQADHQAGAR